jgi:hypothetical protein
MRLGVGRECARFFMPDMDPFDGPAAPKADRAPGRCTLIGSGKTSPYQAAHTGAKLNDLT